MPNDTARGFDAALIEAVARALCGCQGMCCVADKNPAACKCHMYQHDATAALTALCAARPDVAALLAGEAVAVPREATHEMIKAGRNRPYREEDTHIDYTDRNTELTWEAMLAVSPYYNNGQ